MLCGRRTQPTAFRYQSGAATTTYLFHLGYSSLLNAGAQMGQHVAVVGLGVLGMGAMACASLAGARVSGFSDQAISEKRLTAFGAQRCYSKSRPDSVQEYIADTGQGGADIVVLTSDRWDDYLTSLKLLRKRGTLAILGFPGRGQGPAGFNPLDSQFFYDKQLRIQSSNWSNEKDPDAAKAE